MNQNRNKIIFLGAIFLIATFLFWNFLNRYLTRSRAAAQNVKIFFQKSEIPVEFGELAAVNVFFESGSADKISGATVTLDYPKNLLAFEANEDAVETTCLANNHKFTTLAHVVNDSTKGSVSLSRVVLDSDNAVLPSGLMCFSTFYFKPVIIPEFALEALVKFSTSPDSCEIVGPGKSYACDTLSSTNNIVSVIINADSVLPSRQPSISVSPSPTSNPNVTPTPIPTSAVASLQFEPLTQTSRSGDTFTLKVMVDAGPHQVLATDARIAFDPGALEVVSIADGNYFDIVQKRFINQGDGPTGPTPIIVSSDDVNGDGVVNMIDQSLELQSGGAGSSDQSVDSLALATGNIYIAGIVPDPGTFKTGKGHLATVTFRANRSGRTDVQVVCRPGETASDSNIAKNNREADDVIDCNALKTATVTVEPGDGLTPPPSLCRLKPRGDANCDNVIDLVDFEIWRKEFTLVNAGLIRPICPTPRCYTINGQRRCDGDPSCDPVIRDADFNLDRLVNLTDFNIWRVSYFRP